MDISIPLRSPRRCLAPLLVLVCGLCSRCGLADDLGELEIIKPRVNVVSGDRVLGYVTKGSTFTILAVDGDKYLIGIRIAGQRMRGFVPASDVRVIGGPVNAVPVDLKPGWLRVSAATTDLKADEDIVRTLRQGEVYAIIGTQGERVRIEYVDEGQARRAWVAEGDIEQLSQRFVGPSLDDRMPVSISTALVRVDWQTGEAVLQASSPLSAQSTFVIAPNGGPVTPPHVVGQRTAEGIEWKFPPTSVHQALRDGTRSFWLVETLAHDKPRYHRLDLPPLDVAKEVTAERSDDSAEGLVITFTVTGLLAGFAIEHALEEPASGRVLHLGLGDTSKVLPRVLQVVSEGDGTARVRLAVPQAASSSQAIVHQVAVRNPDGSVSPLLRIRRRGDFLRGAAEVVAPARPRPVDATVLAPAVELLTVEQGRRNLEEAGLVPLIVRASDGSRIAAGVDKDLLVLRQGQPAGAKLLSGDELILEVGDEADATTSSAGLDFVTEAGLDATGLGQAQDTSQQTEQETGENTETTQLSQNSTTINTDDSLNFIDVSDTGLIGDTVGLNPPGGNNTTDSLIDPVLTGDLPQDDIVTPGPGGIGGDLISVDPDPGVLIDPTQQPDNAVLLAILKIVISAILRQSDPNALPGPIGQAVTQSLQTQEVPLHSGNPAQVATAVANILEILVKQLRLTLASDQIQAATDDWFASHPQVSNHAAWDANRNGVASDDVVIYFVDWLLRKGLYNPATNIVIGNDTMGNTVAVLSDTPHPANWLATGLPPIVIPGLSVPSSGGATTTSPPTVTPNSDPLSSIPAGKPTVTSSAGPDEVRIPEVNEQVVSAAKPKLDELGLTITNLADLFDTDRIEQANPKQGSWVPAKSSVELNAGRRIPDVTKLSLADAEETLRNHKFAPQAANDARPADVVVRQSPDAGSFAPTGQSVRLSLAVVVPSVMEMQLNEAEAALKESGLDWNAQTKSFESDKVVEQTPPAGSLASRGDRIELTLHVAVPDVRGLTLTNAREALIARDLRPEYAGDQVNDKDTVRGQTPAAKTYLAHQASVRLGPIVSVLPDVRGMTVDVGTRLLRDEEKYLVETVGTLLPTDVIARQDPAGGTEYERGQVVSLDARVLLPNYVGGNLLAAREAIGELGGDLSVYVDGQLARSDVVYSQNPRGNSLTPPRTRVMLTPGVSVPNFSGTTTDRAGEILQAVGLKGTVVLRGDRETTDRSLVNRVVIDSQSPRAGLYRRSEVGVVQLNAVRMTLALRTVPNVIRQRGTAASEQIERAGLTPVIVYQGQSYNKAGWAAFLIGKAIADRIANREFVEPTAASQDPEPGSRVEAASQVRVKVGLHY